MKILALDTATETCSAALLIDGAIVARERRLLEHRHGRHILPMVDALLAESGLTLGALDAIAFGRGPGAFTGVRLAASVTQGLAFGALIPVVPISDLQALAQRVLAGDARVTRVLVCTDARMREVYWGCFERRNGLAAPLGDERLDPPGEVHLPAEWNCNASASAQARPRPHGAGSGFTAYPALQEALEPLLDGIQEDLLPRASEIAVLAAAEVAARRVFPADQALPTYLRGHIVGQASPHSLK